VSINPYGGKFAGPVDVTLASDSGDSILYRVYEEDSGRFVGEFRYEGTIHVPRSVRIQAECESATGPTAEATFTVTPRYTTELHRSSEAVRGWLHCRLSTDGENGYLLELMPVDYETDANRYKWVDGAGDLIKVSLLLPQGLLKPDSVRLAGLQAIEGDSQPGWWLRFDEPSAFTWIPSAIEQALQESINYVIGLSGPPGAAIVFFTKVGEVFDTAEEDALRAFSTDAYQKVSVDLPRISADCCAARIEFELEGIDSTDPYFGILVNASKRYAHLSYVPAQQYFVIVVGETAGSDSDADGVPDDQDGCPDDPNKTEPGNCGCGNPETPDCGAPPDGDGGAEGSNINCEDLGDYDFGSVATGERSTTHRWSIINTGMESVPVGPIVLTGSGADQFEQVQGFPPAFSTNLGPWPDGGSYDVALRFCPTSPGTHEATIEITTDDPGNPCVINVSGTGTSGGG